MLFEPLFAHADTHPQQTAVIDDRGTWTYQQVAAMAAGLGMYLSFQTRKPTVGILLPAGVGFVASFYGTLLAGKAAVRVVLQLLIGMILGAMIALVTAQPTPRGGPLAVALSGRCSRLLRSFHDIVFAQVKVSALNTLFTGIFLLVMLPLFGTSLPFAKTLVVATFVVGLLPVIGNLISNTLIFIVGLSVSLGVGIAALVFLVLIHKLEYFLNARIVGTQIRARAWELLIAMLCMEAAFGSAGLIAAPVYYAYLKRELADAGLI